MATNSRLTVPFALLTLFTAFPPPARARAEPGGPVQNVELRTIAGGKAQLLSARAKANVFVFFRTGQERSIDALKQMADCEKELAGKAVYWTAVVSGSEAPADVQAVVRETGIKMPVLVDEGDVLYDRLGVRLHPMVGIVDGKFKLVAMEPYRQVEYCDVIKTRIKVLLGEATQAELEKVINPERSGLPGSDPMKKAMRDVNMARKLYELGQYAEAVKFAQRALAIAPVAPAYTEMGRSYVKLGKCADANGAFAQAVKLDPKESAAIDAARAGCR
jgi:tetratricopeptide (TPR) repeat protein